MTSKNVVLHRAKENKMENQQNNRKIDRRSFLKSTAVTGAGLAISPLVFGQSSTTQTDNINVALLGAGSRGQTLMNACLRIPGVRIKAVCDIWADYNLARASKILAALKHPNNRYEDYQEMLDKEKDLDAVIIATPDFWHSRHTIACLEAGLNVYCEAEMSNTIEGAKAMVQTAQKTGKLLQIGHQRRSNPRYIYCYEKIIKEANLLAQITAIYGQWNRSTMNSEFLPRIDNYDIDSATLKKYEFDSMEQLRNWRWFKDKSGGPAVELGAHQIDIFNWFLGANPTSIIASGGVDYWKGRDWYDDVMAVYEFQTQKGTVRALYHILATNGNFGFYEKFMGTEGTLQISERFSRVMLFRETWVEPAKWESWIKKGYLTPTVRGTRINNIETADKGIVTIIETPDDDIPPSYDIPVMLDEKTYHQTHLENFFDAIRGKAKLNCPADVAYKTTVSVLKINEAVEAGRKLEFQPEEFTV
jgi:predicted dehydrogenase